MGIRSTKAENSWSAFSSQIRRVGVFFLRSPAGCDERFLILYFAFWYFVEEIEQVFLGVGKVLPNVLPAIFSLTIWKVWRKTFELAIDAGVAGLSIEDIRADGQSGFYDTATSVGRIRATRAAIDQIGEDVVLVARTEILLRGMPHASQRPSIGSWLSLARVPQVAPSTRLAWWRRHEGYRRSWFAPWHREPVNLLVMRPGLSQAEIADARCAPGSVSAGGSREPLWAQPCGWPRR